MTAAEAYELTTQGGTTDFERAVRACERFGPYCLIGGLAVNCYVEPVYKRKKDELDLIRIAEKYPELLSQYPDELRQQIDRG